MNPRFYFSVGQVGAEKAVKAEIAAEFPQLRFAFSRPGFITFKEAEPTGTPLEPRRAIFTRLWGEVLGQAKDGEALAALVATIPPGSLVQGFERDQFLPGDEPPAYHRGESLAALCAGLPAGTLNAHREPALGEEVYSLIWVDDFLVFLGRHRHSDRLSGQSGNAAAISLPAESPSRAYLKIEEALLRFKPEPASGLRVLEVGCAPGGATTALLNRGCRVTGVDPQFMDSRVSRNRLFNLIRKPARFTTADELRGCNPDWLVMDMSIAPLEALDELGHVLALLQQLHGPSLRLKRGFLTIKLNDWRFASSIPLYLKRISELGFRDLRPLQLCANRQEFFVWAPSFRAPRVAPENR